MTEPSKEAIERACEMLNGATSNWSAENCYSNPIVVAFARFIQEVSDVANDIRMTILDPCTPDEAKLAAIQITVRPFIIPEPDMGNLLIEVFDTALDIRLKPKGADMLSAELAKRGYEIRKVSA